MPGQRQRGECKTSPQAERAEPDCPWGHCLDVGDRCYADRSARLLAGDSALWSCGRLDGNLMHRQICAWVGTPAGRRGVPGASPLDEGVLPYPLGVIVRR